MRSEGAVVTVNSQKPRDNIGEGIAGYTGKHAVWHALRRRKRRSVYGAAKPLVIAGEPAKEIAMVYVLAKDGSPLMPTKRYGKVRHMLRDGRAKCVKREPFTIQLTYETPHFTQEVTLGVDCGSKYVGLSATTETEELFAAELEFRTDVSKNITARREFRRARRNRKTRYRKARFDNRRRPDGRLPPSVQNKVLAHANVIDWACGLLPITEAILEIGEFDTQNLKDPDISGADYQHGEQYGFYNAKQYVLWRDGYKCQCCKCASKDQKFNVHHIVRRADGGSNRPDNLVTWCTRLHAVKISVLSRTQTGT